MLEVITGIQKSWGSNGVDETGTNNVICRKGSLRATRAPAFTLSCLWPQGTSFCIGQETPNALATSLWKCSNFSFFKHLNCTLQRLALFKLNGRTLTQADEKYKMAAASSRCCQSSSYAGMAHCRESNWFPKEAFLLSLASHFTMGSKLPKAFSV